MLKWYQYWIKASSPSYLLGWWMMVTLHHFFIQMLSIWCPWNTLKWLTLYMKYIYKGYIKSFLLSLQFYKLKNISVISKIFNNLFFYKYKVQIFSTALTFHYSFNEFVTLTLTIPIVLHIPPSGQSWLQGEDFNKKSKSLESLPCISSLDIVLLLFSLKCS